MSSTIVHEMAPGDDLQAVTGEANAPAELAHLIGGLGERVRALRARRGMTRKSLSAAAGVSERHLANLELGGNPSVLVLAQVAQALHCSMAELFGDATTRSPEWLLLRDLLIGQDEAALARVRAAAVFALAHKGAEPAHERIALVGLRGAGKSTLGAMLAADLGFPFVELSREIEALAGCDVTEIQGLYGMNAYRRYERAALADAIARHPQAVIATPGGLVTDAASLTVLLSQTTSVWLQASAADHMARVRAQGDFRPMAANPQAMADLQRILNGRAPFYAKADLSVDTSAQALAQTFALLRNDVRQALRRVAS